MSDRVEPLPDVFAIKLAGTGGLDVLQIREMEIPGPASDEVIIKVAAAGVNRGDVKQRMGDYPMAKDFPWGLGLEVSGWVTDVGSSVTEFGPGDAVCALLVGGGYATHCSAPAAQCVPVPKGCNIIDAAALPEVFCTVWMALVEQVGIQPGQSLLIHGGTSGIGTAAIQIAKSLGMTVIATAGTQEKLAVCLDLGADRAINYRTQDFVEKVLEYTGGQGVDVILDMVGGSYLERNLDCLAQRGTICAIASDENPKSEFSTRKVMLKRAKITGCTLRHRSVAEKCKILADLESRIWPLFEMGHIRPVVGARFALEDAAAAHEALEAGNTIGKILLTTSSAEPTLVGRTGQHVKP
ncbi:MAG: NAD(P)H-quinone oxidoreductase [Pelagibacterium sp.]|uniref:NAD(P)H-quinone oxidoreductase n=1 Tax=Pelagibacterium sp. TaxID=1967288 RepID=UPI0032EC0DB6